jgi:hypothetical protein
MSFEPTIITGGLAVDVREHVEISCTKVKLSPKGGRIRWGTAVRCSCGLTFTSVKSPAQGGRRIARRRHESHRREVLESLATMTSWHPSMGDGPVVDIEVTLTRRLTLDPRSIVDIFGEDAWPVLASLSMGADPLVDSIKTYFDKIDHKIIDDLLRGHGSVTVDVTHKVEDLA